MFRIHHIDIWIDKVDESINFYKSFGFNLIQEIDNKEENKKIILMKLDNIILEMKHHYTDNCEHNKRECCDNKVFGLATDNIDNAIEMIENNNLSNEKIEVKVGILGNKYFFIHDPNGILIEFIEDKIM